MIVFYKIWKNCSEIHLQKMHVNYLKMKNHLFSSGIKKENMERPKVATGLTTQRSQHLQTVNELG